MTRHLTTTYRTPQIDRTVVNSNLVDIEETEDTWSVQHPGKNMFWQLQDAKIGGVQKWVYPNIIAGWLKKGEGEIPSHLEMEWWLGVASF